MSVPPHDGVAANVSALPGMGSTLPAPIVDRLVSIHAKLLQLVESITEFEQQILYGGNEGMMGWQDILSKYSLLTSYTHSVFDLLVSAPSQSKAVEAHKASVGAEKAAYKTREEQRALAAQEQDLWKRAMAQVLVHPGKTVDQQREFIVGVLLRTKQVPEVEAREAEHLASVPAITSPAELYKSLKAHDDLADTALEACKKLREGVVGREFHWKARITVGAEDEDDEADEQAKVQEEVKPKYDTAELARFMREGILG